MHDVNEIIERLKLSEEIEKISREIETKVLSILDFKDFFDILLVEIKAKFKLPYIWISLMDGSEISTLIQSFDTSKYFESQLTIIEREKFLKLVGTTSEPVMINDNLRPYYSLFPPISSYFIKSLAIAPISLDGIVIGSLNQADFSRTRYQPGKDTRLLEQLAIKVSICLSNVTAHEKLKSLGFHDPLTGLLNRRVMDNILEREFKRDQRYANDLSVIFLDLDNFKRINANYGKDIGDNLLKYVAEKIMGMSRNSDIVGRYAGNEFVIILPETKAKNALNLINRLQSYFKNKPLRIKNTSIPVSISAGVASTEDRRIKSPATLLKRADEMLDLAQSTKKTESTQEIEQNSMPKVIRFPVAKKDSD
ncbi:MAG: sensor domain-containing diguanylate cyclase [Desulfobacterales bacterium]|nr:MAG: sensor domain-containing diguanylate cyclase [Desulfobacterales bacterium]